jgi:hypothetical protein
MVKLGKYLLGHLLIHSRTNLAVVNFIPAVALPLSRCWFYDVFLSPNLSCT